MPLVKPRGSKNPILRRLASKKKAVVAKKSPIAKKVQRKPTQVQATKKRRVQRDEEEEDFADYEGDPEFDPEHFAGVTKADLAKLNHIPDGENDSDEDELRAALSKFAKQQGLDIDEGEDGDEEDFEGDSFGFEGEEGDEEEDDSEDDDEDEEGEESGGDDEFNEDEFDKFAGELDKAEEDDENADDFDELYAAGGDDDDEEEEKPKKKNKKATLQDDKKRKRDIEAADFESSSEEGDGEGVWDADDLDLEDGEDDDSYDLLPTDILKQLKNTPKPKANDLLPKKQKKKPQKPKNVKFLGNGLEVRTPDSILYTLMQRPTRPNKATTKVPATRISQGKGQPAVLFTTRRR